MIRFFAEQLGNLYAELTALQLVCQSGPPVPLIDSNVHAVSVKILAIREYCHGVGYENPAMHCDRILERLKSQPPPLFTELASLVAELKNRVDDETKLRYVMIIPVEKAPRYFQPKLFGDDVDTIFPDARLDIEESGKCYAAGRNTACVLHLLRAMEHALKELVRLLGSDPTLFPNWELLIREVERLFTLVEQDLKLNPNNPARRWKGDDAKFFAGVAQSFRAVKVAVRNPSMHAENSYVDETADDIYLSVRLFMKAIAARLTP